MSRSKSSPVQAKIEEIRRRVRQMPAGGDLDALLNQSCDELTRLLRQEMLAEREACASPRGEADFPPSGGVSGVRSRAPVQPGPEGSPDRDSER